MPLPKVRRLITLLLRSLGTPPSALDAIEGLYSFRRILPTLAHKSEFDTTERLDVGGWTDAKDKTRASMPNLYSAAKLHMQNTRKSETIYMARSAHAQFVGLEQDGEYCLDPTWEQLFPFWPCRDKDSASKHISKSMRSRKSLCAICKKKKGGRIMWRCCLARKVASAIGVHSNSGLHLLIVVRKVGERGQRMLPCLHWYVNEKRHELWYRAGLKNAARQGGST